MAKQWRYYDTYEYSDFNRIESTVKAAYSQFKDAMSLHTVPKCITDRTIYSIFQVEDINRIESNLKYLDFSGTFKQRNWAEGGEFTYEDANRWEAMADLLRRAMAGIQSIRCGTHRCGTWPLYSVIGLVIKKNMLYGAELKDGAYAVDLTGTKPDISTIGSIVMHGSMVELEVGTTAYESILCGTEPEYSVIGLVVKQSSQAESQVAVGAFEVDLCGENQCGTEPEAAVVGKAIQQIIQTDAAAGSNRYAVKATGMKYCGEEASHGSK